MDKKGIIQEIKLQKKIKNFEAMLKLSQNALNLFPKDKKLTNLYHYAQAYYVGEKLHSDVITQLEEKKDYFSLQGIYNKLLAVFPESKKLHKLLKKVKVSLGQAKRKERKAYLDAAETKIKDLIKSKQYDPALSACYEIISYDPSNERFLKLLTKADAKMDKQIDNELDLYLDKAIPLLKAEYKADKKSFIHV